MDPNAIQHSTPGSFWEWYITYWKFLWGTIFTTLLGTGIAAIIRAEFFKAFVEWVAKKFFREKNVRATDIQGHLEEHKKYDDLRFMEIKEQIKDSEDRVIKANDSTKTDIISELRDVRASTDRRFDLMEKTNQDFWFRVLQDKGR